MKRWLWNSSIVIFLIIVLLIFSSSGLAAQVCGDSKCLGQESCTTCPEDCGVCPVEEGATSTTPTTTGGTAPAPLSLTIISPEEHSTIHRRLFPIIVEGYVGKNLDSDLRVIAKSTLFGEIELLNDFDHQGSGTYGAYVVLNQSHAPGEYVIKIIGEDGSFSEKEVLITLDPNIKIELPFKESYHKGERIDLSGSLSYHDGHFHEELNASLVSLTITGPHYTFNQSIPIEASGRFSESHLISYGEPDGEWEIVLVIQDAFGNEGKKKIKTTISTLPHVAFYTVTFFSPASETEFRRTSLLPITIEVRDEMGPIPQANVTFRDPKGRLQFLQEVRQGIYSTEYAVLPDDPLGIWYLAVQAVRTINNVTRAGGNRLALTILPADTLLVLRHPLDFQFFSGQPLVFEAEFTYGDGTPVTQGSVSLVLGTKEIPLIDKGEGMYRASYLVLPEDVAADHILLKGKDLHGNIAVASPQQVTIESLSGPSLYLRLFYHLVFLRYWYLFVLGFILISFLTRDYWYRPFLQFLLKRVQEEEKKIIKMEKYTQTAYFKLHQISKEDYDQMMYTYRKRLANAHERRQRLQRLIHKR
ncbi:hypothetical protein HY496_03410 [Candidatus Woesearchaeota archaeon]|nr:hypothetical protein [Candidatus Woesearchaeota archaeon]